MSLLPPPLERPVGVLPTLKPYYVGSIAIDPPVVLAPMADVTNGAYRRLVKRIGGPGLVVTELISTMAIHHKSARTMTMFDVTEEQRPLAVQLFGADAEIMAEAARVAVGEGADIIDINMGCWVPKVCKTGGGAAMMQDEATACRVVEAIVRAVDVPVTVKTRAGWDYGHLATAGLARKLEEAGAAAFALHARFAVQGHTGDADWNLIREIKQAVSKPVVGNGDIKCPQDAARMFAETGCDGVMIGRAAIGNPWIVRDTVHYLRTGDLLPPPSLEERIEAAMIHVTDLAETLGEVRAVRHLRGQLPHYFRGYHGVARVREAIHAAETIAAVRAVLDGAYSHLHGYDADPTLVSI
ncbi:MAG: tRNA-U20-dihydrouridine synthase [Chthonomonadaceae bacterium]|nr:tRNA-U20-dihydrouridine synthase [Chthonomonadaceae bacterium]